MNIAAPSHPVRLISADGGQRPSYFGDPNTFKLLLHRWIAGRDYIAGTVRWMLSASSSIIRPRCPVPSLHILSEATAGSPADQTASLHAGTTRSTLGEPPRATSATASMRCSPVPWPAACRSAPARRPPTVLHPGVQHQPLAQATPAERAVGGINGRRSTAEAASSKGPGRWS